MDNKTITKRLQKILNAFGVGVYTKEVTHIIEKIYERKDLTNEDICFIVKNTFNHIKGRLSLDGIVPRKKREESAQSINARYEKQLAKLNKKYGRI